MKKKLLALLIAFVSISFSFSSSALSLSSDKKTTTRKLDDWYISNDGKYGVAIFGLDKHYNGTYYVTIYVKKMSTGQVFLSGDFDLNDLDENEWQTAAKQHGYKNVAFVLSDDHAIQEFEYVGSKKYSFNICVDIILDYSYDDPINYTHSLSFSEPR